MRASLSPFVGLCAALLCAPVFADDAGPVADAASNADDEQAQAGAADTPLAKARALDAAGNTAEAIAAYEVALPSAPSREEAATIYCRIARLEASGDTGDREVLKRIARYVEACTSLAPESDDAVALSLKYSSFVSHQLDVAGLEKHIARLLPLVEKGGNADVTAGHRQALLRLSHMLHLAKDDRATSIDDELLRRYDTPTTRCNLAEAAFARWSARRDPSDDVDELQRLMADCIEKDPAHVDMPGLYQDLLVFRYARPVLLGVSLLVLLAAVALAALKRKKDGPKAAT